MSARNTKSARSTRSSTGSKSGRHNKIYHCPPTPPPEKLLDKEKSFVLDNVAMSSISQDYSRTNPKLGAVIPPWNSQTCRHSKDYFKFYGVEKTLKRTGQQENKGTSLEGLIVDRFHVKGAGHEYLAYRNEFGAGHSREYVDGHAQFMQDVKPVIGYHGYYGFRRNTPWLRAVPSPFGLPTRSPLH